MPSSRHMAVASTLALLMTACEVPAEPQDAATPLLFRSVDMLDVADGRGVYVADRDGRKTRISFALPLDEVDPFRLHDSERLGETDEGVVVMLDRYASRAAPDGGCADGRETWVRVFSLPAARELLAVPAASCRRKIKGGDPDATWLAGGVFRIETPTPRTYAIEGTTAVRAIE
jgi:hypothetical protein